MLNRRGNRRNFAEANRLPILARGRSIKNSVSVDNLFYVLFLLKSRKALKIQLVREKHEQENPLMCGQISKLV